MRKKEVTFFVCEIYLFRVSPLVNVHEDRQKARARIARAFTLAV